MSARYSQADKVLLSKLEEQAETIDTLTEHMEALTERVDRMARFVKKQHSSGVKKTSSRERSVPAPVIGETRGIKCASCSREEKENVYHNKDLVREHNTYA